jgi:hypothetical protein
LFDLSISDEDTEQARRVLRPERTTYTQVLNSRNKKERERKRIPNKKDGMRDRNSNHLSTSCSGRQFYLSSHHTVTHKYQRSAASNGASSTSMNLDKNEQGRIKSLQEDFDLSEEKLAGTKEQVSLLKVSEDNLKLQISQI